ncbi:putative RNA-binding Zn-ribbon protein involved in translation (DUF1610 family) [Paenibacillus phyllosphaerae]|uniref:Putative RNA-binding Zn-ribbon protein involved in translation (DUF1610 family) n=1 Tax=Paenibacillus phyllosphaerae TaxID=274593 RepID=A0A7W5B3G2_9BACL|nr:TniQ family protein [Paenibacillus phyllosphaerae]MBB3113469.1 putative RNA-binding Zn-ribbon protein involved in translation (DUF1610 family) [Paenibacillus phyllosphaerae]
MNLNGDLNIVWRREWARDFETPWSIFEKLSVANVVDRDSLLRTFGNETIKNMKGNLIGDHRRELMYLASFDEELIIKVLGYNLFEHNRSTVSLLLGPLSNFREKAAIWFSKQLRWCSECVRNGIHSWFHQFTLVEKCPYHGLDLINACPNCMEEIPFLLSNRRLGSPFTCKCGFILADFSTSRWREWEKCQEITDPYLKQWLSRDWQEEHINKWIFIPQYGSIELLTGATLRSTLLLDIKNAFEENMSSTLQEIFYDNKSTFLTVDRYIRNKFLKNHSHCIKQFREMRKGDEYEFPKICPYAFAYVFWRKTLLVCEFFYNRNTRGDNIEEPRNLDSTFQVVTKLIKEELQYLYIEFERLQLFGNVQELKWVLNKVTSQFSIDFFNKWLEIAEEWASKETAPSWDLIQKMKQSSFYEFAFKINRSDSSIEYHQLRKEALNKVQFNCPNCTISKRRSINHMRSFTPMTAAMNIFDNPSDENKRLMQCINLYVSKLRF